MANHLVILPEAVRDGAEAYDWYEGQRPGLGEAFLSYVDACILSIRQNPEMYPIIYEHEDDTVTVFAIFHGSQDPAKWRKRLP